MNSSTLKAFNIESLPAALNISPQPRTQDANQNVICLHKTYNLFFLLFISLFYQDYGVKNAFRTR